MNKGLRVVKLVAENVKGLKAVEIIPDDNFQVISGKNEQGKTSVLDVIWLALAGGAASKSTVRPVRDGADNALASVDLGDIIATRKWTSNEKSTLQVVSKEGAKFSSPQKMLDELVGKLSFDPLAFSNLDTKDQLKTLLELVNIDPTPIELQKKKVFDDRTIVNREVKALKTQLESFPAFGEDVPDAELQPSDILKEMTEAQTQLQRNNEKRTQYNNLSNQYNALKQEIEFENKQIAQLEAQLAKLKQLQEERSFKLTNMANEGSQLHNVVQSLVDPDMTVFNTKLAEVDEINKKVRNKQAAEKVKDQYKEASAKSNVLTAKLSALEEEKQNMISAAKFPIEGLSFDETGVLYNGVPFKQCSAAERLRVSMAMAMALNPKLKVIRILDGSLLDSTNMKVIESMAKEQDYQVWIEVVDESGKVGITIENGEVKNFGGNAE